MLSAASSRSVARLRAVATSSALTAVCRLAGLPPVPGVLLPEQKYRNVVDSNTLNLDLDPEFWPNLDPDPKLCF